MAEEETEFNHCRDMRSSNDIVAEEDIECNHCRDIKTCNNIVAVEETECRERDRMQRKRQNAIIEET